MICPNLNDPLIKQEFDALVAEIGEDAAYNAWYLHDGNVPKTQEFIPSFKPIKPGVQELFDSNPELSSIGTPQQYSQYLGTIFPDSQVKDIVYHGTDKENIEFIKNNVEGYFTKVKGGTPNAVFFSKDKAPEGSVYDRKFNVPVILNFQNSLVRNDEGDRDSYPEDYKTTINNAEQNGHDGVQILNYR